MADRSQELFREEKEEAERLSTIWFPVSSPNGTLLCSCGRPLLKIGEGVYKCKAGYPIYRFDEGNIMIDKFGNLMIKGVEHPGESQ